jgi:hypothetical protein
VVDQKDQSKVDLWKRENLLPWFRPLLQDGQLGEICSDFRRNPFVNSSFVRRVLWKIVFFGIQPLHSLRSSETLVGHGESIIEIMIPKANYGCERTHP